MLGHFFQKFGVILNLVEKDIFLNIAAGKSALKQLNFRNSIEDMKGCLAILVKPLADFAKVNSGVASLNIPSRYANF